MGRFFLIARDTNIKAARIQYAVFKTKSISEKMETIFELSDNLQTISKEGIKSRHPDYAEKQVIKAYLKLILKDSMLNKIYS